MVRDINTHHENISFLPGISLPPTLVATGDLQAFTDGLTLMVIVVLVGVVLVIGVAIAILAFIVAIPYFARGREIQTDMSYDINDVEEVDGKMLNDKKD